MITWLIIFIVIISIYVILQGITFKKEKRAKNFFSYRKFPIIFAHRGGSHLFPENTEFAFDKAFEMGIRAFETDIRITKDDYIITHHNEDIDETSDGSGNVIDYNYDEIKEFNFGYKFEDLDGDFSYKFKFQGMHPMRIDKLFEKFGSSVLYSIDIKDEGDIGRKSAEILYEYVKKYELEKRVIFASFHDDILDYVRAISDDDIVISGSQNKTRDIVLASYFGWDCFAKFHTAGLQIPTSFKKIPLATKYLIYKLHKHNMFAHYWTVNTKEEMEELIEKKVDAITTDRIDIMLDLKRKYENK